MTSLIETIKIKKGKRIAQLMVSNIMYPEIKKLSLWEGLGEIIKDLGKWIKQSLSKKLVMTFLNILICIIIKYNEQ